MGKSNSHKEREKKCKRSSYSGRVINGREAILSDEAEEFLKKRGYKIIKPEQMACVMTLTQVFLMLGGYLIWV